MFTTKNTGLSLLLLLIMLSSAWSCKNSDSWLAKKYHNTLAHYNRYFNAEQQFLEVYKGTRETVKDDYRSLVPIINLGNQEGLKNNQPQMDEVIKRTSTLIDNFPKSKWVDDSYLLNGQAYMMKGDLYASREIFDYTIATSKDPMVVYTAKLWFTKSLLLQKDKLGEAESYVLSLKQDKDFPKKLISKLNTAIADMYLVQGKYQQAYKPLQESLKGMRGKQNKYRTHFALGQVCLLLNKYNEAEGHFAKTVKMNPPYEMAFQSSIAQVEVLSAQGKNYIKANKILQRMLKDDKNIDYYGKIYYQIAENELKSNKIPSAKYYFQKSIYESKLKSDNQQLTKSYIALGDHYFCLESYVKAGNYYDSARNTLDEAYPNYEEIETRFSKLKVLVTNILQIKLQDSLLRMAKDDIFRERSIDNAIEAEKQAIAAASKIPSPNNGPGGINPIGGANPKSSFPFYNPQLKAQGEAEFKRKWGPRPNMDNWRYNSRLKKLLSQNNGNQNVSKDTALENDPLLKNVAPERKKYMAQIPFKNDARDAAYKKIEDAYLQVAEQYNLALDQPEKAAIYYEEMLSRFPATEHKARIYYKLIKIYTKLNNVAKANEYRALLKSRFPESNYLKILDGKDVEPNLKVTDENSGNKEIIAGYQAMYVAYTVGNYNEALTIKQNIDKNFMGNQMQPKFEYLKALCNIRLGKQADAVKALDQIIIDYPSSETAVKAQELIDAYNRIKAPEQIVDKVDVKDDWEVYNGKDELYYLLSFDKGNNSNLIRAALSDYCKENYVLETLIVNPAQSFGSQVYMYISGFSSPKVAKEFLDRLKANPTTYSSKGLFEYKQATISKTNLQKLVKNKRVVSYMNYANQ
jgi:tetratricopeptide (TPR) repeat protein